jgi:hypothetical protein
VVKTSHTTKLQKQTKPTAEDLEKREKHMKQSEKEFTHREKLLRQKEMDFRHEIEKSAAQTAYILTLEERLKSQESLINSLQIQLTDANAQVKQNPTVHMAPPPQEIPQRTTDHHRIPDHQPHPDIQQKVAELHYRSLDLSLTTQQKAAELQYRSLDTNFMAQQKIEELSHKLLHSRLDNIERMINQPEARPQGHHMPNTASHLWHQAGTPMTQQQLTMPQARWPQPTRPSPLMAQQGIDLVIPTPIPP